MRLILILCLVSLSISCVNMNTTDSASPYQQYIRYSKLLSMRDYDGALAMLSSFNKSRFANRESQETFELFFPFFASVDNVVTKEDRKFHSIIGKKSCLTISGFNDEGEPATLNFELLSEEGDWKFQYVHMIYHGSEHEFPLEATCPRIP